MYQYFLKPSIDFTTSLFGVVLLLPVLLVVILLLAIANKGKVCFYNNVQENMGNYLPLLNLKL